MDLAAFKVEMRVQLRLLGAQAGLPADPAGPGETFVPEIEVHSLVREEGDDVIDAKDSLPDVLLGELLRTRS